MNSFSCVSNHACTHMITQTLLPHCKYELHHHDAKWICRLYIVTHIYQNTTNCNNYFTHYCQICARNKYSPDMSHMQISYVQKLDNYVNLYTSYELTVVNSVTRSTAIHILYITDIPLNTCLAHCICMSNCTSILVYI